MDLLRRERAQLEEKFIRYASIAYRGIRKSLILNFDGRDTNDLFRYVLNIITQCEDPLEDKIFTDNDRLMHKFTTESTESGVLVGMATGYMERSVTDLFRRHLDGLDRLTTRSKVLWKRLDRRGGSSLPSARTSIRETRYGRSFLDGLKEDLRDISSLMDTQIIILACIDIKLAKRHLYDGKIKFLITKMVHATRSLIRFYKRQESDISIVSDSDAGKVSETKIATVSNESGAPGKNKKTKCCKVTPWPLEGDFDEYMLGVFMRHDNYDIFLASSFTRGVFSDTSMDTTTSLQYTPSRESTVDQSYHVISPWPGHFSMDAYMRELHRRGIDYTVFLATCFKPKVRENFCKVPHDFPCEECDSCISRKEAAGISAGGFHTKALPISQRYNIYVRAILPYRAQKRGELSLKVGQKLKQKSPANNNGMAYGWTRGNRMSLKRLGFYPIHCVELWTDDNN